MLVALPDVHDRAMGRPGTLGTTENSHAVDFLTTVDKVTVPPDAVRDVLLAENDVMLGPLEAADAAGGRATSEDEMIAIDGAKRVNRRTKFIIQP